MLGVCIYARVRHAQDARLVVYSAREFMKKGGIRNAVLRKWGGVAQTEDETCRLLKGEVGCESNSNKGIPRTPLKQDTISRRCLNQEASKH